MDKFETLEDYQNSLKEFNERTRKSYENFIQEHGDDSQKLQLRCTPYTEKKGRYGVASLDFGFQIWQSRQAEVDELNQLYLKAQHQEIRHRTIAQDALALVEEKDKRVEAALFQMRQQALSLKEDCDGYKDPVGICQSEGVDWCVRFLEKALQGFQGDRS